MGRRIDADGRVRLQGLIGRTGLDIIDALIEFVNFDTGRCDPSYAKIAEFARCSVSSVTKCLRRLKDLGVINWVRRCTAGIKDGRYTRSQDTNAYALLSSSGWRGARKPPPPAPAPEPSSWGATPPMPGVLSSAADALSAAREVLHAAGEKMDRLRRR